MRTSLPIILAAAMLCGMPGVATAQGTGSPANPGAGILVPVQPRPDIFPSVPPGQAQPEASQQAPAADTERQGPPPQGGCPYNQQKLELIV